MLTRFLINFEDGVCVGLHQVKDDVALLVVDEQAPKVDQIFRHSKVLKNVDGDSGLTKELLVRLLDGQDRRSNFLDKDNGNNLRLIQIVRKRICRICNRPVFTCE